MSRLTYVAVEDIRTKDDFPEETHASLFIEGKYLLDVLGHKNYCSGCGLLRVVECTCDCVPF